jgi:hypothetical protein
MALSWVRLRLLSESLEMRPMLGLQGRAAKMEHSGSHRPGSLMWLQLQHEGFAGLWQYRLQQFRLVLWLVVCLLRHLANAGSGRPIHPP